MVDLLSEYYPDNLEAIICLFGNDGTGKSTLVHMFEEVFPRKYVVIERSLKGILKTYECFKYQIKQIDRLTYTYSFEKERYDFEPASEFSFHKQGKPMKTIPVVWIMLDLYPNKIQNRIRLREYMGIYESKKCVEYFSFVYRELAYFYGMTIVNVEETPKEIVNRIDQLIETRAFEEIRSMGLKSMQLEKIKGRHIETQIVGQLNQSQCYFIYEEKVVKELQYQSETNYFYFPMLTYFVKSQSNNYLKQSLAAKWIASNCTYHTNDNTHDNTLLLTYHTNQQYQLHIKSPYFSDFIYGYSKKIYRILSTNPLVSTYFKSKLIIILKSTIYSHTKQHTGIIANLAQIRAQGSNIFLYMLRRNNILHAYYAINYYGIILSEQIQTNYLYIIFKKQYLGTDKHSYFNMNTLPDIVHNKIDYKCGVYIRFDWRNPNHTLLSHPNYILNLQKYYYLIEHSIGKYTFFEQFLRRDNIKSLGDKCVTEDLIAHYVDTHKIKYTILKMYCTFAYYAEKVGLYIIDGCAMLDSLGSTIWSEINPDCMRVKKMENGVKVDYDKDIWRAGGSASKDLIVKKWTIFNYLFMDYFKYHRFHLTELLDMTPLSYVYNEVAKRLERDTLIDIPPSCKSIFRKLSTINTHKQLIGTIDISKGEPKLVKSSQITYSHSQNSLYLALNFISILPKLVIVDLDAAITLYNNSNNNNRRYIAQLVRKYHSILAVGGGIRTIYTLGFYLNTLALPKVIISSNLSLLDGLKPYIIANRVIVYLSINYKNEILTHGRTINTGIQLIAQVRELARKGVTTISITFHNHYGHLQGIPKRQFAELMHQIPGSINTVIIAGGCSSLDDLYFIWGFYKCIPQLGSALWNRNINIGDIFVNMINFNKEGLCPVVVVDEGGTLLGEIYMDEYAVRKTCYTRYLYRYSRKLQRVIKKGYESNNNKFVKGLRLDCDNDCINVTVSTENPLCHTTNNSCFEHNKNSTLTLLNLQLHLYLKRQTGTGYSKFMQYNPGLAFSKVCYYLAYLQCSSQRQVYYTADLLAHLMMYLNSKNIRIGDVMHELTARAYLNNLFLDIPSTNNIEDTSKQQIHYLGVVSGKHYQLIDKAIPQVLGIYVVRQSSRNLSLTSCIISNYLYNQYFSNCTLELIGCKSKDIPTLLSKKKITSCFNYSIMMENNPIVSKCIAQVPIMGIKLVLLKKIHREIEPSKWTKLKKGIIASEYPVSIYNYFNKLGISEECFTVLRVFGGTYSYLYSNLCDYCDAIMETGRTIQENHLEVVAELCSQIYGGYYVHL